MRSMESTTGAFLLFEPEYLRFPPAGRTSHAPCSLSADMDMVPHAHVRDSTLQRFNFTVVQRSRITAETHETHDAWGLQDPQAIFWTDMNKDIPRKQGEFQFLLSILPAPDAAIQRQEQLIPLSSSCLLTCFS